MKTIINVFLSAWLLWSAVACTSAVPTTAASPVDVETPVPGESQEATPFREQPEPSTPSPAPAGSALRGVFEGITPCSDQNPPLPQIPVDSGCEQMIWKLTLYQDAQTGLPTTYTLDSAYGVPQQNTTGLARGKQEIGLEGRWATIAGTKTDADAVLYQLNPEHPAAAIAFLKVSDDLLHVLSHDLTLLVGNGAWSYTLNRTDNRVHTPQTRLPEAFPEPPTRPAPPPTPAGAAVLGIFDGRMPCHAIVSEFTQVEPYPGCMKIKLRLTLYQDETTGEPGAYLFMGTSTYRQGAWTILHGAGSDPAAVVYQLTLDGGQEPVSFLRVDENHLYLLDRSLNLLVGDALWSFTLSRVEARGP